MMTGFNEFLCDWRPVTECLDSPEPTSATGCWLVKNVTMLTGCITTTPFSSSVHLHFKSSNAYRARVRYIYHSLCKFLSPKLWTFVHSLTLALCYNLISRFIGSSDAIWHSSGRWDRLFNLDNTNSFWILIYPESPQYHNQRAFDKAYSKYANITQKTKETGSLREPPAHPCRTFLSLALPIEWLVYQWKAGRIETLNYGDALCQPSESVENSSKLLLQCRSNKTIW